MKLGEYDVTLVSDGEFRLDGGAMFGIVPKVLWERLSPLDERNRISMALSSLLVRGAGRTILVDTGVGTRNTPKETEIFAISRADGGLRDSLRARGVAPEQVTDVVLTHLHFDHAGGAVAREGDGRLVPAFPNATYHVHRDMWDWAQDLTPKDRGSFRPDDYRVLRDARLRLAEGREEICEGVEIIPTYGHTVGNQVVKVAAGGETLLYAGDVVPTSHHLKLPYVMAYDLFPLTTIREKAQLVGEAADGGWIVVFEHDPKLRAARVARDGENFRVAEPVAL